MAIIAIILYFRWAKAEKPSRYWFAGPTIMAAMFSALAAGDIATLPML
jgi:hypothetical protein